MTSILRSKNRYTIFRDIEKADHFIALPVNEHAFPSTKYLQIEDVVNDVPYITANITHNYPEYSSASPSIKMHTTKKTLVSSVEIRFIPSEAITIKEN